MNDSLIIISFDIKLKTYNYEKRPLNKNYISTSVIKKTIKTKILKNPTEEFKIQLFCKNPAQIMLF